MRLIRITMMRHMLTGALNKVNLNLPMTFHWGRTSYVANVIGNSPLDSSLSESCVERKIRSCGFGKFLFQLGEDII